MPVCRFLGAIAIASLVFSVSCGQGPTETLTSSGHKLKIKYFYSIGGNRGYAPIEAGVEAALADYEKEPDFNFKDYVEVTGESDDDSPAKAEINARRIRRDPDVLAVIGHGSSATTFAALPFYSEAGIPIIIPNASSPSVLSIHPPGSQPSPRMASDHESPHFSNAVRLIPGDVPDQAHAMALTIKKIWGRDQPAHAKVLLICEDTQETGASVYSRPICDHLNKMESRAEGGNYEVVDRTDLNKHSVESVLPILRTTKPDFVVVASYPLLARLVLQVWHEDRQREHTTRQQVVFIMPDACLAPEIRDQAQDLRKSELFQLYITYPMNLNAPTDSCAKRNDFRAAINKQAQCQVEFHHPRCEDDDKKNLKDYGDTDQILGQIPETAEAFAYDSVLILEEAVKDCVRDGDLGRACVGRFLQEHHAALQGLCQTYHVEKGDRLNAHYFVYYPDTSPESMKGNKWPALGSANEDDYELDSSATGQQLRADSRNEHN